MCRVHHLQRFLQRLCWGHFVQANSNHLVELVTRSLHIHASMSGVSTEMLWASRIWALSEIWGILFGPTMEEIWGIKNLRIENPLRKGRIYKYSISLSLSLCASHTSRVQISNPKFDVRKLELLSIQIWIARKWGRNTSRLCHHAQGIGFTCCISIRGCLSANLTAVEVVPPR